MHLILSYDHTWPAKLCSELQGDGKELVQVADLAGVQVTGTSRGEGVAESVFFIP